MSGRERDEFGEALRALGRMIGGTSGRARMARAALAGRLGGRAESQLESQLRAAEIAKGLRRKRKRSVGDPVPNQTRYQTALCPGTL